MYGQQPIPRSPQHQNAWEQHLDAILRDILKEVTLIRQQRQQETAQAWKNENPELAKQCGRAFDRLAEIQNEFIEQLVVAVDDLDVGYDSAYALREFTDKFGQVSIQLNNVMSTLRMLRS